jgi:TctA family transporter
LLALVALQFGPSERFWLMPQGATPGPRMFELVPTIIYSLFNSPLAIGLAIAVVILTWISSRVRMSERMQDVADQEKES